MYVNIICDAGQVPILRYFEARMQSRATIDPSAKRHLNGVSPAGRQWPDVHAYILGCFYGRSWHYDTYRDHTCIQLPSEVT